LIVRLAGEPAALIPSFVSNRLTEPLDAALDRVAGGWREVIELWRATAQAQELVGYVNARMSDGVVIYPAQVLRALELTPLDKTRVVIVGQDPYHGPGQAHGLAFSVESGEKIPPSLRNICRELEREFGFAKPVSGDLSCWAQQGVLLLNTTLTVEEGRAASHAKRGWEALTDRIILEVARASSRSPKVFMLWGAHAHAKLGLIEAAVAAAHGDALVLKANHPSPLSAARGPIPFVGCGHFRQANDYLAQFALQGETRQRVIDWRLY
jgi:uracil-DNA glycosylase